MNSTVLAALIGSACTLVGFIVSFATERLKAKSARNNHISQARFDKEFEIYQELSEKNLSAVNSAAIAVLIARGGYNDEPEEIEKHIKKMCDLINDAEFSNNKYAPFIDKSIYEDYKRLEIMIGDIFYMLKVWTRHPNAIFKYHDNRYDHDEVKKYIEDKQKEVNTLSESILDKIRNYLQKLDVKS